MSKPRSTPVNLPLLIGGFVFIAALVGLLAIGFTLDPRSVPTAILEKPAPSFTMVDLDGNEVELESLRGEPVVLNFWSTWCQPCKLEHPVLLKAAEIYPEVHFYGVIYDDDPVKIRRYLARAGAAYPHLIDPDGSVAVDYGITGVPETFFIDRNGLIVKKMAVPAHPDTFFPDLEALVSGEMAVDIDPDMIPDAELPPPGEPPAAEDVDEITFRIAKRIRCVQCQGSSIADSPSRGARAMRARLRELVAAGHSEEVIYDYFEGTYSEWVLMEPKGDGLNWIVWIVPGLLAGAVLAWMLVVAGRWGRGGAGPTAAAETTASSRDVPKDPYEVALLKDLED